MLFLVYKRNTPPSPTSNSLAWTFMAPGLILVWKWPLIRLINRIRFSFKSLRSTNPTLNLPCICPLSWIPSCKAYRQAINPKLSLSYFKRMQTKTTLYSSVHHLTFTSLSTYWTSQHFPHPWHSFSTPSPTLPATNLPISQSNSNNSPNQSQSSATH